MLKLPSPTIKTITLCFILFFSIVVFFCCNPASGQSTKTKVPTDTIPKVPTYVIRIPVTELQKNLDSLNMISSLIGMSMTVDGSNEVKRAHARILGNILKDVTIDSTTVPKPKK